MIEELKNKLEELNKLRDVEWNKLMELNSQVALQREVWGVVCDDIKRLEYELSIQIEVQKRLNQQ